MLFYSTARRKFLIFIVQFFRGKADKVSDALLMLSSVYMAGVIVFELLVNNLHGFKPEMIGETLQTPITHLFEEKRLVLESSSTIILGLYTKISQVH